MEETIQTEEVAVIGDASLVIDLNKPIEVLRKQAEMIAESGIAPTTIPEHIMIMWQTGKELGFPPMASLNNIFVVEQRAVINKHLINALLNRAGWKAVLVEDFVPINQEGTDVRTTYKFINVRKINELIEKKKELVKIQNQEIVATLLEDYKLEAEAYVQYYSFTWSQAASMNLTGKSNWLKMPAIMMQTRALVFGARHVAPEAMMGMMEITEWSDAKGVEYKLDEDGNVIHQ